jgi:putative N6-adenine-specific DNA methylase
MTPKRTKPEFLKIFVVCGPGIERYTKRELEELGLLKELNPGKEEGGVEFSGSLRDVYRANLNLRTATRVFVNIGFFPVTAFPALRQKAAHVSWEDYLQPGRPVAMRVACHGSRLYHSGAVAEYVLRAIADRLGKESPVQKLHEENAAEPPQLIGVRIVENICTLSVDSSGPLLHRRGYRLATAKAPIRETLAAAMVMASEWDRKSPLLDPFCGAGTIVIEGAMLARNRKPGYNRHFAFMGWPNYVPGVWKELQEENRGKVESFSPLILASDRDAGAIRAAEGNADRAGVRDAIQFFCRSFSAMEPPSGKGWVITNPPYGVRLKSGRDLEVLYTQWGGILRKKCRGWRIAMLGDNPAMVRLTGLNFDRGIPVFHGGLNVRLFRGEII